MKQVIYKTDNLQNLTPRQSLDSLANLLGIERGHLVYHLPELEAYKSGNVNIRSLEDGNYQILGDLAGEDEPVRYFSPLRVQFYSDRDDAMTQELRHSPDLNPSIVALPQKIDIVLEKQAEEEPVYLIRDKYQDANFEARTEREETPVGVIRAVLKREPAEEDLMNTYDNYQEQITVAPEQEERKIYVLDTMSNYQPFRMVESPQREAVTGYMESNPELHGYRPVHLQQMSRALQTRNPLHLSNKSLKRRVIGRALSVQEVIRIALWVAVGILVGVLLGIYFT